MDEERKHPRDEIDGYEQQQSVFETFIIVSALLYLLAMVTTAILYPR